MTKILIDRAVVEEVIATIEDSGEMMLAAIVERQDRAVEALRAALAEPVQEPVECEPQYANEDGWCEWVCPVPVGYLMQCCDCGLIHEVESRVAKYELRPSERFEVVDDPDLQAQWRMKRRDDISPKQAPLRPAEPVAWRFEARHIDSAWAAAVTLKHPGPEGVYMRNVTPLYTAPPQRPAEPVQEPAFHGFMSADGTRVDLCFTPGAPRADGTYATAYYTAPPPAQPVQEPVQEPVAVCVDDYPDIWQTYMNVGREEIERFAALVAAAEREACAKVCESEGQRIDAGWSSCAAAIRARNQQ